MTEIQRLDPGPLMSQATIANGVVHLSGQVALDSRDADFETQAAEIYRRIDALLAQAGTDRGRLLTATIWLTDRADFDAFNRGWSAWLDGAAPPARATVQAELMLPGLRIEIQVTAALP